MPVASGCLLGYFDGLTLQEAEPTIINMFSNLRPTTGISEIDQAVGGIVAGDNVVWEIDSGVVSDQFITRFVAACEQNGIPIVYVSFNRSPQTIASKYGRLMSPGHFTLVDCFSSGKGNRDEMFLKFFEDPVRNALRAPVHITDPSDPSHLEQALIDVGTRGGRSANYVFDSLTGMLDLWGDESRVVRFFGHICPRLYDLSTIAFWLLETEAHSEAFLAKVRHITQVVIELSLSGGQRALTVRKASGRKADIGEPKPLFFDDVTPTPRAERRTDRDLDRLTRRGEELRRRYRVDSIVGGSAAIRRLLGLAAIAARSRSSVLITGETGTGKELIANVVHYNSERANNPLIKVNCGALPDSLLESELFGHVKGAFTGAVRNYEGRFRAANSGTLFLDEVAEMSPHLQVKVLRVLQERQFEPVGSSGTMTVDVRIVAATSRNLREEIRTGRFRNDLFYRLNVIPIHLPPLRERREDIPLLVDYFLEKYSTENGRQVKRVPREVMDKLLAYPWPGNIRELENCVERAVVMSSDDTFSPDLLPDEVQNQDSSPLQPPRHAVSSSDPESELRSAVIRLLMSRPNPAGIRDALIQAVEETLLHHLLSTGHYSQRELARLLGLSRVTLRKKLEHYGISKNN
jgi:transcriptional regulator with PAS, ATPase and Fis domain